VSRTPCINEDITRTMSFSNHTNVDHPTNLDTMNFYAFTIVEIIETPSFRGIKGFWP
jgi:hypothetical protein